MKDADYKHRSLIAMSTTGKLSPVPTRTQPDELQNPVPKVVSRVPRPRIASVQPAATAADGAAPHSKTVAIKNFFKGLVGRKG